VPNGGYWGLYWENAVERAPSVRVLPQMIRPQPFLP
jgi:hypothetical protein